MRLGTVMVALLYLVFLVYPFISKQRDTFVSVLSTRADADRFVILAMTDEAFSDMAINFYEASLRAHHIDNFLFVGVGREACKILSRMSIACFFYADDPNAGEASSFQQQNFVRKMNIRTDMILEALTANFTVIHTDVDVAFLNSPISEIKVTEELYFVSPLNAAEGRTHSLPILSARM